MTPIEALRCATTVSAELLGIDDRTGKIAEGLEADLIVIQNNPLDNILSQSSDMSIGGHPRDASVADVDNVQRHLQPTP